MKKIIFLFAILLIGLSVQAQHIFRPVTAETFMTYKGEGTEQSKFIFRPTVSAVAVMYKLDENNKLVSSPFARAGLGMSYAHYILVEGEPYNNYSFNGLFLFPTDGTTNLATALTVSAFQYINVGVGYDFVKDVKFKQNLFFITGVSLTF